jgi:hypothetical protein
VAAQALETAADLADQHAKRSPASGQRNGAGKKRQVAKRTREAARLARSEGEKWLKASNRPE